MISALTTVVVLAIVARSGDPGELGLVAVGLTVGLVLAVISEAGLSALLIREVARAPRGVRRAAHSDPAHQGGGPAAGARGNGRRPGGHPPG